MDDQPILEDAIDAVMAEDPPQESSPEPPQVEFKAPEESLDEVMMPAPAELEIDLREMLGAKSLTDADIAAAEQLARAPRDAKHVLSELDAQSAPWIGPGFQWRHMHLLREAELAVKKGTATHEQEKMLLFNFAESLRPGTAGGVFAQTAVSLGSMGLEMFSGAGIASAGTRLSLSTARKAFGDQFVRRMRRRAIKSFGKANLRAVQKVAGVGAWAAGTAASQEAGARYADLIGVGTGHGYWKPVEAKRLLERLDINEDPESAEILLNENQDVFMEGLDQFGAGLMETLVNNAIEQSGAALAKIPGIAHLKAAETMVLHRIARKFAPGVKRGANAFSKLFDKAAVRGGVEELAEEFAQSMTTDAMFGSGDPFQSLPDEFHELLGMYTAMMLPGAAGTGVAAFHARQRAQYKAEIQAKAAELAGQGTETATEGGDSVSSGEATAETAEAEPDVSVTPEMRAQDAADFSADVNRTRREKAKREGAEYGGDYDYTPEGPSSADDLAAQRWARRRGLEPTFVAAPDDADPAGVPPAQFLGDGRVVIVKDSNAAKSLARHEAVHAWAEQQGSTPEERAAAVAELAAELRELDAEFLDLAGEDWAALTAVDPTKVSPELFQEESVATGVQGLSPFMDFLETPAGALAFEKARQTSPGKFRRVLNFLWDWIADKVPVLPKRAQVKAQEYLEAVRAGAGADPAVFDLANRLNEVLASIKRVERRPPTQEEVDASEAKVPPVKRKAPKKREKKQRGGKRAAQKRAQEKEAQRERKRDRAAGREPGMTGRGEVADLSGVEALQSPVMEPRTDAGGTVAQRKGDAMFAPAPPVDPTNPDIRFAVPGYHGGPYTFDRFDTSKIGTGEGAQAYGWGLYFASKREVAEWYRSKLGAPPGQYRMPNGEVLDFQEVEERSQGLDPDSAEAKELHVIKSLILGDFGSLTDPLGEMRSQFQAVVDGPNPDPAASPGQIGPGQRYAQSVVDAIDRIAERGGVEYAGTSERAGSVYKVTLAPDEDEYLLWDEPLSGQSEKVRGALEDAGLAEPALRIAEKTREIKAMQRIWGDPSGSAIYNQLAKPASGVGSQRAASLALLAAGIRGIKYLDGASRGKGEGDYNYVIFDDADVTIDERFAIPTDPDSIAKLRQAGFAAPGRLTQSWTDAAVISSRTEKFLRKISDRHLIVPKWLEALRDGETDLDETFLPEEVLRAMPGREAALTRRLERVHRRAARLMQREKISVGKMRKETNGRGETRRVLDSIKKGKPNIGEYVYANHAPEGNQRFADQYREMLELREARKRLVLELREVPRDGQAEADLRALERRIDEYGHLPRVPKGEDIDEYFNEVNPRTGMKTSEAQDLLEQYHALENADAYRRLQSMHDSIARHTADYQLERGLISAETHANWRRMFEHYAPLRTAEVDGPQYAMGRGLDVKGPEVRRRLGRSSLADNPFVMNFTQALNAYRRGEKNRTGQEFYDFMLANRHIIDVTEREGVKRLENNEGWDLTPTEFHLKIDGRDVAIDIQNEDLARALKGTAVPNVHSFIRLAVVNPMNLFRAAVTQYSPDFIFRNLFRDSLSAQINMLELGEEFDLEGLNAEVLKLMGPAVRAGYRFRRGKTGKKGVLDPLLPKADPLADYYREYIELGGEMGMWGSPVFRDQVRALRSGITVEKYLATRSAAAVGRWVSDANLAVEHASRVALFIALRRRGVDARKAVREAKRITVDFSQRGEWGAVASTIWAFFSASVGGTRRSLEALRRSKRAKAVTTGIFLSGMAQSFIMSAISDTDDDDGLLLYDKLPDYIKEMNMVLWMDGDDPVMVPMPYFYSWFHNLGRVIGDGIRGVVSPQAALSSISRSAMTNFSPISGGASAMQFAAPTVFQPVVQIWENKKFHGGPVHPTKSPWQPEMANWSDSGSRASWAGRQIARGVNFATGGFTGDNRIQPGLFNMYGDDVDHFAEFFLGGPMRTLNNIERTMRSLSSDRQPVEPSVVPVIRVFYGARTEFTDRDNFYTAIDDIKREKDGIKRLMESGDKEAARERERRLRPILALEKSGRAASKRAKQYRDKAYGDGGTPDQEWLDRADATMKRWYRRYLTTLAGLRD